MSRRTSVMLEVTDDVYNSIVDPMKKNKSFAKLVASLLKGYMEDTYIRAYVDDGLEEVRKAVVGSFEDSVADMESTLVNMGLLTDELGVHAQSGFQKFQKKKVEQAEELEKDKVATGLGTEGKGNSEVEELRTQVNNLSKSVQDGFDRIIQMLSGVVQGTPAMVEPVKVASTAPAQVIVETKPVIARTEEPVKKPEVVELPSDVDVVDESDGEIDASGMLQDLIASFGYN